MVNAAIATFPSKRLRAVTSSNVSKEESPATSRLQWLPSFRCKMDPVDGGEKVGRAQGGYCDAGTIPSCSDVGSCHEPTPSRNDEKQDRAD